MNGVNDSLFDAFIYEMNQLTEKVELILLECERIEAFDEEAIGEIFRIMHTIKGSAAMMEYHGISMVAHALEDLFYFFREEKPEIDFTTVGDLVLLVIDFIKSGIVNEAGDEEETSPTICLKIHQYLDQIRRVKPNQEGKYRIEIFFEDNCGMESIRALTVVMQMEEVCTIIRKLPEDLDTFEVANEDIQKNGFTLEVLWDTTEADGQDYLLKHIAFLKECKITQIQQSEPQLLKIDTEDKDVIKAPPEEFIKPLIHKNKEDRSNKASGIHNFISVNVEKIDRLMDIVGELVISESIVTMNPEITKLRIKSFTKAASQLTKITSELQDIILSIRMVPIGPTFYNMQRIVRDMAKKLDKKVELVILGEDTEVDKNVIDHLTDPLMHMIRNCIDHGIEDEETRARLGKPPIGKVILNAKLDGSDILVTVMDDGKGLDREGILKKAKDQGFHTRDDLSDQEVWSYILLPGFSTKQEITEFSGRGVGMDVVMKNIDKIGGRITIDSQTGKGMTISIRIPLTLAIIDGMEVSVGETRFDVPITSIKKAIIPRQNMKIIQDTQRNELIMYSGKSYEIIRLHRVFNISTNITDIQDGILLMVESDHKNVCLFADRLIGEHQVVKKPVPEYFGTIEGVTGCSILGDGSISLILDIGGLMRRNDMGRRETDGRVANE